MTNNVNKNAGYYGKMEPQELKPYAKATGLENNPDIQAIHSYVSKAKKLVEIGPGYGRVIDDILQRTPQTPILGLESQPSWAAYLQDKYRSESRVEIRCTEVGSGLRETLGDLVLAPWSVLMDTTAQGVSAIATDVAHMLAGGGNFLVELPQATPSGSVGELTGECITLDTPYGVFEGRMPSLNEFSVDTQDTNLWLSHKKTIPYQTGVGLERRWEVFETPQYNPLK